MTPLTTAKQNILTALNALHRSIRPRDQGAIDRKAGKSRRECPYPVESLAELEWRSGWMSEGKEIP